MRILLGFLLFIAACDPTRKTGTPNLPDNTSGIDSSTQTALPNLDTASSMINYYIRFNERLKAGVQFKAQGNEPFWSVEITNNNTLLYKTAAGEERTLTVQPNNPEMPNDTTTLINAGEGAQRIELTVKKTTCIDDMSGFSYPYTVEIAVSGKRNKGCGSYLADYRIHDIWVLKAINDSAIQAKGAPRGAPLLEIDLNRNEIRGHSGCNGLGGNLEVKGKTIAFKRVIGTMMACEDGGLERDYLSILNSPNLQYEFSEGRLQLKSEKGKLSFQKTD